MAAMTRENEYCPRCGDGRIGKRIGDHEGTGGKVGDETYRCYECHHLFNQPEIKEIDYPRDAHTGLAAKLEELDADDVGY